MDDAAPPFINPGPSLVMHAPSPVMHAPSRKRAASEPAEDPESGNSSSSTTPAPAPGRKRAADIPTEDLADAMDILSINVGSAFDVTAQGSISGIYSPPPIVPHAEKAGFAPGWSLDLTVNDEHGQPYDFSTHECREKARQLIHKTQTLLLVGPQCVLGSAFSRI